MEKIIKVGLFKYLRYSTDDSKAGKVFSTSFDNLVYRTNKGRWFIVAGEDMLPLSISEVIETVYGSPDAPSMESLLDVYPELREAFVEDA